MDAAGCGHGAQRRIAELLFPDNDTESADTKSMGEEQRRDITEKLETMAVPMEKAEFTREEYNKLFPFGKVKTPIGIVRLGAHQFEKLEKKQRENLLGPMKQTLEDPIVVLEEVRDGAISHVYIKSFSNKAETELTNVISIAVNIEGTPTVISTGKRRPVQIEKKLKMAGSPLYIRGGGGPTLRPGGTPEGKPPLPGNTPTGAGSTDYY